MSLQVERRVSFNGGEWSPWADARLDTVRYNVSCRKLENMTPNTYGGAFSRGGLVYIATQDNEASVGRGVSFEFSAETHLTLLFTDGLMRPFTTGSNPTVPVVTTTSTIWTGPGTTFTKGDFVKEAVSGLIYYCAVTHVSTTHAADLAAGKWSADASFRLPIPYTSDELAALQFEQLNDLIYITHPNHQQRVLSRYANNRWTIEKLPIEFPPLRDENITDNNLTAAAVTGSTTIESNVAIFDPLHVGSLWVIKHRRENPFVELEVDSAIDAASDPLMVLGSWSCSIMTGEGTGPWDVTAVVQRSTDKSTWETIRTLSASRQDRSSLITGTELEPCWLRVKKLTEVGDTDVPANGNWKLEAVDPDHYGIVEVTSYLAPDEVAVNVLFELGDVTSTTRYAESSWSDYRGWPRAVCIADQSIYFGGNASQPHYYWKSVINDFGNFRTGANDDLGIATYNSNQKSHVVQWLVSHGDMLVGTSGAEGPMERLDSAKAIGPSNIKFGRFTQTGSAAIQAVAASDAVLFVSKNARKVWELAFTFESDGYKANDLTQLAEHITNSKIVGLALQKNPEMILWAWTEDGQLLGLLYERSQEVAGWFRYTTAGFFESVCVVPGEGESDEVWCTVRRVINGQTRRFFERFQPDRMRYLKDATDDDMLENQSMVCCADAAVIRTGAATATITGLSHLEGETVCVLADGAPQENKVVDGGQITLDVEASTVIVGLPFVPLLSPTYFETGDPGSVSKVASKCISKVVLHLWKSMGCEISTTGSSRWERLEFTRQGVVMDQALPLFSGIKESRVAASSQQEATVIIRQTQPLPLNIQALHVFHEMNGTP